MDEPRNRFVNVNGLRFRVLQRGIQGPNVLILPGITSPAMTWDFVTQCMARFCRTTTVDMRGRGLSDKPPEGYGIADYVEDTAALIEALDLNGCVLLGHSMGARVGLVFAADHPNLITKLVSVDPPTTGPGRPPYKTPLQQYFDDKRAMQHPEGPASVRRQHPGWSEEQVKMRVEWLPTCSDVAIASSYRSMHEETFYPSLPRIVCPTLLVYAAQGNAVSDADAAHIIELIPSARLVRIEHAGHMIPWDNLDDFMSAVQTFITDWSAR